MPMSPRLLRPRAAASTVFDPRSIANCTAWYDASAVSSLTASGGAISEWGNFVSGGVSHTQTNASLRPTVSTLAGRSAVRFADSGQTLTGPTVAQIADTTANAFTAFVVIQHNGTSGRTISQPSTSGGQGFAWYSYHPALQAYLDLPETTARVNGSVVNTSINTAPTVARLIRNGANVSMHYNGVPIGSRTNATGSISAVPNEVTTLGVLPGGTPVGNNILIGEVIYYSRGLSLAEIQAVEQYLGRKWGAYPYLPPTYADADVNAYVNAVETADGAHLETGVRDAINAFVVGCKADGIWSAIKASCIMMGARTITGALVSLVGPAPTPVGFVSGDYNRKTGLLGTSGKSINTNRANNADGQNDCHAYARVSVGSPDTGVQQFVIGSTWSPGNERFMAWAGSSSDLTYPQANNAFVAANNYGRSAGGWGVARNGATSWEWMGGPTTVFPRSEASAAPSSVSIRINKDFGGRTNFYSVGSYLSLSTLNARVATLTSAISAAIP